MRGCLTVILFVVGLIWLLHSCGDMNDDGPDDGECYYSEPIPHYDTC